jgi:hypothetical protein
MPHRDKEHLHRQTDKTRPPLEPADGTRHSLQPADQARHSLQPTDRARLYFFLGLLAIAILYSFVVLCLLSTTAYLTVPRNTRHLYKFGALILAWLIGFFIYRKIAPAWLLQLWNISFAASLSFLLVLAAYDAFFHTLPLSFRDIISTFHEVLISPVPYVVFGLLNFAVNPTAFKKPTD